MLLLLDDWAYVNFLNGKESAIKVLEGLDRRLTRSGPRKVGEPVQITVP